ncbi:hypothetical protein HGB24_01695 [Candidatus Saccharibacteria bacterium]|nr:hypothetical protein [Candidatus Saccharibacteria bacterium]
MNNTIIARNDNIQDSRSTTMSADLLSGHSVSSDSQKLYDIAKELNEMRHNAIRNQKTVHAVDKNNFIKAIAKKLFGREWKPQPVTIALLKRKESAIGASLFYSGRPNERVEFFNDNQKSWFFYQEVVDSNGVHHSTTLHYEVNPHGIMKVSNHTGMKCEYISGKEYENFMLSAQAYFNRVKKHLYSQE